MNEQAIAIFCICDEIVKSFRCLEDSQHKMTTSEVMAFALISAMYYRSDYRTERLISMSLRYFPNILSHSRLVTHLTQAQ